jgi:DMSO/TMAO reductase YedYZ molybdopterin-dependent catalytic subunit
MMPTTISAFKCGSQPLSPDHGCPVRLIVPHLRFWKSVKWVRGFELTAEVVPGFR